MGNFYQDDGVANGYDDGFAATGTGSAFYIPSHDYTTDVGAYTSSPSYYGTFDQGGNVLEWNETSVTSMTRGERGGDWDYIEFGLRASVRISDRPTYGFGGKGFRVAAAVVPEPSAALMAFAALASLGNLPRPRK